MNRVIKYIESLLGKKQHDKMQILPNHKKLDDFFKSRGTHSQEVALICRQIGMKIGFYKLEELEMVGYTHDAGHPPFGHDGQKILNRKCKEIGIEEGFDDNSNNITVLNHNNIEISDYEMVSLIKYPKKLYPEQKKIYIPILERYIAEEKVIWGKNLKRTVACNIMDLADEIAYGTSDVTDSYTTGYTKETLAPAIRELAAKYKSHAKYYTLLCTIAFAAEESDKRMVRETMLELKLVLIDDVYWDYEAADVKFKQSESNELLKDLIIFSSKEFIHNDKVKRERSKILKKMEFFMEYIFTIDDPENIPSSLYREKYKYAKTELDRMKVLRDLIADTSDQYVLDFKSKLKKKKI
jgi:dGTPase